MCRRPSLVKVSMRNISKRRVSASRCCQFHQKACQIFSDRVLGKTRLLSLQDLMYSPGAIAPPNPIVPSCARRQLTRSFDHDVCGCGLSLCMHLSAKRTRPGALACSRPWCRSPELTWPRMPQAVRTSSSAARKGCRAMVEAPKTTDRSKTPPRSRDLKANPEAEHLLSQASVQKRFQGLQFSPELVAIALGRRPSSVSETAIDTNSASDS